MAGLDDADTPGRKPVPVTRDGEALQIPVLRPRALRCERHRSGGLSGRGDEGAPARRLPRASSPARARASGREGLFRRAGAESVEPGIELAEFPLDLVDGNIGVAAAPAQVLHVPAPVRVERMEDRVLAPIELERPHAEALAQGEVERRRRLDPLPVEEQLRVSVVNEQVAAHGFGEPRRGEMVLHVGEAHARRDLRGARAGCEQRGLADAEPLPGSENRGRSEHGIIREIEKRVVADAVAHRIVKGDRAAAIVGAGRVPAREPAHRRVRAVDEAARCEIFRHLSSFISRRAPARSALDGSARASSTEKWFLPGIGMSPANAARQRSPSSRFWRLNSLDSSPPTQVITGARDAGGMNAGETWSADASSSRRSPFSHSTWTSGRRSYRPLTARPPFHRSLGSRASNAGQSAHITIATRCPPPPSPPTNNPPS